jgi:hypothetical protein
MKIYYFPIASTSLAHYFGCACIKPSKYFENKLEDIQNSADSFLLLTERIEDNPCDCCLELILTESEYNDVISINDGCFI